VTILTSLPGFNTQKIACANRLTGVRSLCPPANRLGRPRGLRGCNYGAAGPCRTLSAEERQAIEIRLRREGRL